MIDQMKAFLIKSSVESYCQGFNDAIETLSKFRPNVEKLEKQLEEKLNDFTQVKPAGEDNNG